MKHDGSLHKQGEVTPLQRVLLSRRSNRKFAPGEPSREQLSYIVACVDGFRAATKLEAPRIVIIERPEDHSAVIRAAMKGLVGKINPWLPFMKAKHLILCGALYPAADGHGAEKGGGSASPGQEETNDAGTEKLPLDSAGSRLGHEYRAGVERAVKEASMAMQVAVLAATEVGLATCWLAGINHERIEKAYQMPDGARLVAISPLGVPTRKKGLSWDSVTFHLISKRRMPLEKIWMREQWGGEKDDQ